MRRTPRKPRTADILPFPTNPRQRKRMQHEYNCEHIRRAITLGYMCLNDQERQLIESMRWITLQARADVLQLVQCMTRTHPYVRSSPEGEGS
jgi:hypothetical protein